MLRSRGATANLMVIVSLAILRKMLRTSSSLAQFAWCCIREMLRVSWNPNYFVVLFGILQLFNSKCFLWTLFVALSWAFWTTRNKFSIEAKFPKHPANCIFKTAIFLQLWRPLQKPEVQDMLDETVTKLKDIFAASAS
jgi:hypothetical protein